MLQRHIPMLHNKMACYGSTYGIGFPNLSQQTRLCPAQHDPRSPALYTALQHVR